MGKIREAILKTPWLTADLVTMLRLVSTIPLIILVINESYLAAFIVFTIMSLTDLLDGYLARLKGKEHERGAIFDSVTDMIFFLPSFLIMGLRFLNPVAVILIFILEVFRGILALMVKILKFPVKLSANIAGKIKAWPEALGLASLLLNPFKFYNLANILFAFAIIFAITSIIFHIKSFLLSIKS